MRRPPSRSAGIVSVLFLLGACDCGDSSFGQVGDTEAEIVSPRDGATISHTAPVLFSVRARNEGGIDKVRLLIGDEEIHVCTPARGSGDRLCELSFNASDYGEHVRGQKLTLRAIVEDTRYRKLEREVEVSVRLLRVSFAHPRPAGSRPTQVVGVSRMEINVGSIIPVAGVQVSYSPLPIVEDRRDIPLFVLEAPPFARDLHWAQAIGIGEYRLAARAFDREGNSATARMDISISCSVDGDCGKGKRCCKEDGVCHPVVGAGAICDCTRPCAADLGCFPGPCNQAPRRCRPGCFPGDREVAADSCAPVDGLPTYCAPLPVSERTPENKGGACAPGDGCDILAQNCPDLPVDRSKPANPTSNPVVPHNCIPAGVTGTMCVPASNRGVGATGCADACGAVGAERGCGKGLICLTTTDEQGQPLEPTCFRQCDRPGTVGIAPCRASSGPADVGEYCVPLQGAGGEHYPSGACR